MSSARQGGGAWSGDLEREASLGKAYDSRLIGRLWKYVRPYRRSFWLSMICLPLSSACALLQPYLLKRAIDGGEDGAVTVTHWGKRKLAYPIGRKEQGVYVILRYQTEPERLTELERLARIDEQVLRHLTVVDPVDPAEQGAQRVDHDKDEEE